MVCSSGTLQTPPSLDEWTHKLVFDNSYARLPEGFYQRCEPEPSPDPQLIAFNQVLAEELGFGTRPPEPEVLAEVFSGTRLLPGSQPLASVYAGHQFGHFVPQLGDGRAHLLGEVIDTCNHRKDLQLKGSGRTAFSRSGDGRAPLGPVLREYLLSEAMHALGLPTTRALAAVTTGETVYREQPEPGAVLTRVASHHIRVGSFLYFAARQDHANLQRLADYTIARTEPQWMFQERPYLALFENTVKRQAQLVAGWMNLGFIHGVMNTDNTSLAGETLDYGPCAFLDRYQPERVFSYVDRGGRYAFDQQPRVARWNLARLGESLLPLIDKDQDKALELAKDSLERFDVWFDEAWRQGLGAKLGLERVSEEDDVWLQTLLDLIAEQGVDFTLFFALLTDYRAGSIGWEAIFEAAGSTLPQKPLADKFNNWRSSWEQKQGREDRTDQRQGALMRDSNPRLIPRNHRIQQVIDAAINQGDLQPFHRLLDAVTRPYEDSAEFRDYQQPPAEGEVVTTTFCGT